MYHLTDEKWKYKEDKVGFPQVMKQINDRAEKNWLVVARGKLCKAILYWRSMSQPIGFLFDSPKV